MRVFDQIGVWDKVKDGCSRASGAAFVHYQTLEILTGQHSYDWAAHPTSPDQGGNAHRGQVHGVLAEHLRSIAPGAIFLNHRLKHFTQDDSSVRAEFENGDSAEGALMIGCDGISAVTQRLMFGQAVPTEFTGVVAYRAIVPRVPSLEPYLSGGRSVKYVGPGRGLNRYGIMDGTMLNCVALVKTDAWDEEGWAHPCTREEFLAMFADFHEDCQQVIKHAPATDMFKWGLRDREPLSTWQSGRVTLLGDAAHPMLPYMSQGACSAIEDAMVLIRCLSAYPDFDDAFKAYEANRLPRTAMLMKVSRAQGDALNQVDPYDYPSLRPNRVAVVNYDPVTVSV
jgi:salicylate hydroxylase